MKLINILMVSLFALGMVFAQEGDPMAGGDPVNCEDWVSSPGAYDATGDGKIDLEDCEAVHGLMGDPMAGGDPVNCEDWVSSPGAYDATGDGKIDLEDCEAVHGLMGDPMAGGDPVNCEDWVSSPGAYDATGDGKIDLEDCEAVHGLMGDPMAGGHPPNCEEWLNSPEAHDMNGDGVVDMADCEAMKGPPPFGEIDANEDGVIDREEARVFFGEEPNFDAEFDRIDSNGDGGINWTEHDNEMNREKEGGGEPVGFYCPGCDIHFATQEEMDSHVNEMHSDMGAPVNCEDWVNSPGAYDATGDGKIDLEDCEAAHGPAPSTDMGPGGEGMESAPEDHFDYGIHTVNNCIAMAEGQPSYWVDNDEFATWDNPQCEEVLTNIGWHPAGGN